MKQEYLNFIQDNIGYRFKNPDLLQQAFVRCSYAKENGGNDNEVLEFIGDKALDFIIVKWLTEKYGTWPDTLEKYEEEISQENPCEFVSQLDEGTLTDIKKKLVCRQMLASRIKIFGFQYLLDLGKSDIEQNVREQDSVQEDLFEAIIGAVAIDSGWNVDALTNVVELMLDPNHYLKNGFDNDVDYVKLVQQWYQKKYDCLPIYTFRKGCCSPILFSETTSDSEYQCDLAMYPIHPYHDSHFRALGGNKSEARMAAAKKAYEFLQQNNLLFSFSDEVGKPDFDRAINQLQELYQKGHIEEPIYHFSETHDQNGNPVWMCECDIPGSNKHTQGEYSSKKQGKKAVAFDMLCEVLNGEGDHEA